MCYGIDQKDRNPADIPGMHARFRCDWFLDNKNSVIGELCAYHVSYHRDDGVHLGFVEVKMQL